MMEQGSAATGSQERICGTKYFVRRGEPEIVAAVDEPSSARLQIVVQKRKMGDWSTRTSFRGRLMKITGPTSLERSAGADNKLSQKRYSAVKILKYIMGRRKDYAAW